MSYPQSPVVLPLICPSWALALYVAHHDGKVQVEGVPPPKSSLLLPSLSVGCASAAVVLIVLTAGSRSSSGSSSSISGPEHTEI